MLDSGSFFLTLVCKRKFRYNGISVNKKRRHVTSEETVYYMEKTKKPNSLKRKLLVFMIVCWGVPIAVFFAFTTISYRGGIIEKAEGLMEDELESAASFASIRIDDAISFCQRPSYEQTWEDAWRKFQAGEYTKTDYLVKINRSLKGKFSLSDRFNLYAFYREDADNPACYSSREGTSYANYIETIQPKLARSIASNSSYTNICVVDGRIFIVRSLYTTVDYRCFGTLVVELNRNKIFRDVVPSIRNNMVVCFNSNDGVIDFMGREDEQKQELLDELLKRYDGTSNQKMDRVENISYNGYLYQKRQDSYHIGVILFAEKRELYSSLYEFYAIVLVMLLLFIPLFAYAVLFLRNHIQIPIRKMLDASQKMEAGEMGVVVDGDMPNLEFQHLKESFDSMSAQVKSLFEYAYDEKLARKDAQIQALQAQINPHFLNNTLEMMNWQARMSGDAVVSKMIESLSTVLDYRMNRANVKEIHLAEELQCIDAYFYIMTMRFGQRLQIEKEIDDELLYIMVPPLILQPIVENAIVHGVESVKNGTIHLKVFHDESKVYLQVRNTGKKMTEQDLARIHAILEGDESQIPKTPGRHTSIGIQNVNRRIRLVYGEEYGLTIVQGENMVTVSTITVPYMDKWIVSSLNERNGTPNGSLNERNE